MTLYEMLSRMEKDEHLHQARLLLLLDEWGGKEGTGTIDGLTKLAKLDFLLRYPSFLERAIQARGGTEADVEVQEFERKTVEASMVRYRYGPWDFRYRKLINSLVGKGMAVVSTEGRTIVIGVTAEGRATAAKLRGGPEYHDLENRAGLLHRHLDLSATNLKNFIYKTFPEIADLSYREVIRP